MGVTVSRHEGPPPSEDEILALMQAEGLAPHGWGNGPGDTYGWHEHGYEKVLYCVRGRIMFHTGSGDADLGPGDRLVLSPRTPHAATVGAEGVRCVEAARLSRADRFGGERGQAEKGLTFWGMTRTMTRVSSSGSGGGS